MISIEGNGQWVTLTFEADNTEGEVVELTQRLSIVETVEFMNSLGNAVRNAQYVGPTPFSPLTAS